jgi:Uri superfamily endonuclease
VFGLIKLTESAVVRYTGGLKRYAAFIAFDWLFSKFWKSFSSMARSHAEGNYLLRHTGPSVRWHTATYLGYLLKRIVTFRYWLNATLCMETDVMSDLSQWSIHCFLCGRNSDCSTKTHHFFVAELEIPSRRVAIQFLQGPFYYWPAHLIFLYSINQVTSWAVQIVTSWRHKRN